MKKFMKNNKKHKKKTIYEVLKERIKREPTNLELKQEVQRILDETLIERSRKE